jgi:hypothetical protein
METMNNNDDICIVSVPYGSGTSLERIVQRSMNINNIPIISVDCGKKGAKK